MIEDEWPGTQDEPWRGDEHLEDWPEDLAGPEYRMYKQILDTLETL